MLERWRVQPGTNVDLEAVDPASTPGAPGGKEATLAALPALTVELADLQDRLAAEARRSLLVVLQAPDAGGKDGTIRHVFHGVNPQGTRVHSFKAPAGDERAHDFLWRVHRVVPAAGEIGIFNRSHYEDVLAVRVRKLVAPSVWRPRFELIGSFEALLAHEGTTIVKLYLHISKEEQRERLQARLDDPDKRWKFRPEDLADRVLWDRYRAAYNEAISRTATSQAPWFIVPADHKWYRNWAVSTILVETLRKMDPRYPQPAEALPKAVG
ncbi:MAG TPA: polyphosphate kinase 2 family protein [Actinomycetota bacterium]|nr:polyphosphate kinase 2 family protein [Actinomycetota bacterium]